MMSAIPPAPIPAVTEESHLKKEEDRRASTTSVPDQGNLLNQHKGKLAMGVAAMLGIAVFYQWREHRLAKEDPVEYEKFRRIKDKIASEKP